HRDLGTEAGEAVDARLAEVEPRTPGDDRLLPGEIEQVGDALLDGRQRDAFLVPPVAGVAAAGFEVLGEDRSEVISLWLSCVRRDWCAVVVAFLVRHELIVPAPGPKVNDELIIRADGRIVRGCPSTKLSSASS